MNSRIVAGLTKWTLVAFAVCVTPGYAQSQSACQEMQSARAAWVSALGELEVTRTERQSALAQVTQQLTEYMAFLNELVVPMTEEQFEALLVMADNKVIASLLLYAVEEQMLMHYQEIRQYDIYIATHCIIVT